MSLTVILGAVLAGLAGIGTMLFRAIKAGKDAQRVKEAKARAENLKKLHDASRAKPTGSVLDDPNNRDNR